MRFTHPVAKLRFVERPRRPEGWKAIHRAAERGVRPAQEAFRAAIGVVRRAVVSAEVRAALERGAPEIAVSAIPWARLERALEDKLLPVLTEVAASGGRATVRDLQSQLGQRLTVEKAEIHPSFMMINPEVLRVLSTHGADLVTQITRETQAAIQEVLLAAQQNGLDVQAQASRVAAVLRQSIGLTAPQARALANYEISLTESGWSQAEIGGLLQIRRERMLTQRGLVIARNETMTAANAGQADIWRQATDQGLLETEQKREWLTQGAVNASNPCPICKPMNGQIRGMNENFTSPSGWSGRNPPAHVGCMCVVVLSFDD